MTDAAPVSKLANRLVGESSPYLLQHAHNPVDWYPWGPEAFEASRRQNKPIFLSVGYSTCYWCHVMERQSFENEAVVAEMNQRFINIKVDREERPDVDQLYMTAVQVLTRHGGWPMSVFLTPDLRPFYGGTYFPPSDAQGRPGFVSILRGIEDAYQNRPADVEKTANQLVDILGQYAAPPRPRATLTLDEAFVDNLIRRSVSDYDPRFGGFGGSPKFPRETLLELLLVYLQRPAEPLKSRVSKMIRHTLDALADGGIRDQLGGGFHRYSTDDHWLVPHFEIMLYDNAMLAWCYVEAHRQTAEARDANIAREVFDFVLREMTSPAGGFFTAFDAEVDGQEGLNYLWTTDEIEAILGPDDARLFNSVYGVDRGPNFADPHHGSGVAEKNILFLPIPLHEAARGLKVELPELESRLAPMRRKLYQVRMQRKQPLLDTKIITSWNALMIRALAHGGKVLNEPRYLAAAAKAADFLLDSHRTPGGGLFRASRDGAAKYDGFLDDYAFLIESLLALHEATGVSRWADRARELALLMSGKFADADRGGYYFTQEDAPDLIVRQKTAGDSPLPSGNAVAAMALLQLGDLPAAETDLASPAGAPILRNRSDDSPDRSAVRSMADFAAAAKSELSTMLPDPSGGSDASAADGRRQDVGARGDKLSHGVLVAFAQQLDSQGEGMSSMVQAALLFIRQHGALIVAPGDEADAVAPPMPGQRAKDIVAIQAHWQSPTELLVRASISAGYHINAHDIEPELSLIATRISAAEDSIAAVSYPAGEALQVPFTDQPIRVYSGEIEICVRLRQPRQADKPLTLSFLYQACDETSCLPPVTKQIEV